MAAFIIVEIKEYSGTKYDKAHCDSTIYPFLEDTYETYQLFPNIIRYLSHRLHTEI